MKSECVCNPHFYPSHTFSLKLGPSCEVLMVMFSLVQSVQFSPVQSSSVQSCPVHCDPMDCSLPGSSVHGIFQARVLEWGAIAFSAPMEFLALLTEKP